MSAPCSSCRSRKSRRAERCADNVKSISGKWVRGYEPGPADARHWVARSRLFHPVDLSSPCDRRGRTCNGGGSAESLTGGIRAEAAGGDCRVAAGGKMPARQEIQPVSLSSAARGATSFGLLAGTSRCPGTCRLRLSKLTAEIAGTAIAHHSRHGGSQVRGHLRQRGVRPRLREADVDGSVAAHQDRSGRRKTSYRAAVASGRRLPASAGGESR